VEADVAVQVIHPEESEFQQIDDALEALEQHKDEWAKLTISEIVDLLDTIRVNTDAHAERWVKDAIRAKGIPEGSPIVGEEWASGPWALVAGVDHLSRTLKALADGKDPLKGAKVRARPDGQTIVKVHPADIFEDLLLNGVTAEVWMQEGVTPANVRDTMGVRFRPGHEVDGKIALILGAGNIASIPPLDMIYKLVHEGQVCIVKMNPVNDYLGPIFEDVFKTFVDRGFVRFVYGGAEVGAYLTGHDSVAEIHITGSERTHDVIVYGPGEEGRERKERDEPINTKRISSELGGVGPTIVVPGPWTEADIQFQAEHIATQKMHNGGFNCIAAQVLVLPQGWEHSEALADRVESVLRSIPARKPYYPNSERSLERLREAYPESVVEIDGDGGSRVMVRDLDSSEDEYAFTNEFFAGALSQTTLPAASPEAFLRAAVKFANERLHGTLGAQILIHPKTIERLGPVFEQCLADLKYGTIGINAWSGVGFLMANATWGAYPGHERTDIQSGVGVVHNAMMFEKPQKTVVRAPFAPFPRSLTVGERTMLPKPPWYVTNKTADETMRKVMRFAARPGWGHLPSIFASALRG